VSFGSGFECPVSQNQLTAIGNQINNIIYNVEHLLKFGFEQLRIKNIM
jgi:hypothetical protein